MTIITIALAALFAAQEPQVRVLDWCSLPGHLCVPCVGSCDGEELNWCCDYAGGGCTLVEFISECDPSTKYVVQCDWGQNNPDGTITCYE